MGGVNGLIYFDPKKIKLNNNLPIIAITSFKVFEIEAELDTQIVHKTNIDLPYSNNFFSIEFASLDFHSPGKNRFAYKLEGFHDNWIYSGNRRFVSFSHLDPGEYLFKVKGSNSDGLWNEAGTSLMINIIPPFWLTSWFKFLSGTLILTVTFFSLRYFLTRKYKRQLLELSTQQKIQNERERISRELHDNIGSNLTSIITGLEISKKFFEKGDKKNLSENISSLETHTRNTIDELRQTIWSLHEDVKTIADLNEKIRDFILHQIKFHEKPEVNYYFSGDDSQSISSVEALNLFRIIQEGVSNALKYADCSNITISAESNSKMLSLKIKDDGKGFDLDNAIASGNNFGLKNMKLRAEQINAGFEIYSDNSGSTIKIIKEFD